MIDVEALRVATVLDPSGFQKGMAAARQSIAKFAAGAAIAVAGVSAFIGRGLQGADRIEKLAVRTGISANALLALEFAAGQADLSTESLSRALLRMQQSIGDAARGNKPLVEAFGELGVNLEALQKLTPEKQLGVIADALLAVSDDAVRGSIGTDIFGRQYHQLIPLLSRGSATFQEAADTLARFGIGLEDGGKGAAAALDAIARLGFVVDQFSIVVASAFTGEIKGAFDWLTNNLPAVLAAIKAAFMTVGTLIGGLARAQKELLTGSPLQAIQTAAQAFSYAGDAYDQSLEESLAARAQPVDFGGQRAAPPRRREPRRLPFAAPVINNTTGDWSYPLAGRNGFAGFQELTARGEAQILTRIAESGNATPQDLSRLAEILERIEQNTRDNAARVR